MNQPRKPFILSEGTGPTVICLHGSGGSSGQWKPLIERLRDHFRVMAVDLYGHGLTSDWKLERPLSIDDEAELVRPLVESVPQGVYLIARGYGAAVALKVALAARRNRIRGLVLYEPTPFALLYAHKGDWRPAMEIGMLRLTIRRYLKASDPFSAAQRFVDYWSGDGSWRHLRIWQRYAMAQRMPAVQAHLEALLADSSPLAEYAKVDAPVVCLTGGGTRAPIQRLAQILVHALPCAGSWPLPGTDPTGSGPLSEEGYRAIEDLLGLRCGPLAADTSELKKSEFDCVG